MHQTQALTDEAIEVVQKFLEDNIVPALASRILTQIKTVRCTAETASEFENLSHEFIAVIKKEKKDKLHIFRKIIDQTFDWDFSDDIDFWNLLYWELIDSGGEFPDKYKKPTYALESRTIHL